MKPSNNIVNFIKQREGFRNKAYLCPAGIWTIGYGTIKYDNGRPVQKGDTVTEQESEKYLAVEVTEKSSAVNRMVNKVPVNQQQFDALVSFAYNLGNEALRISSLLRKVKNNPNDKTMIPKSKVDSIAVMDFMNKNGLNEINTIHMEFMKWCYVRNPRTKQKEISRGLQLRRDAEWRIYNS